VKQARSNPLIRELRRAETAEAHPFEDVLTAFAENALLERERREVVEHLSRCGTCREVLGLATAAAPEASVPAKMRVLIPRQSSRSWLPWAFAAAGVVVVSLTVLVYERGAQVGGRPGSPATVASTELKSSPGGQRPNEESHESVATSPARVPGLFPGRRPGLAEGSGGRAHWRINDAGQVEWSTDAANWQTVMPGERAKMHVVWVSGSNVWVGGDGLRLLRSADEGGTWQIVELPNKTSHAHAITHIRFQSEQAGTVEADDGTRWGTADGGQSWK
jgi:hypothetical protein